MEWHGYSSEQIAFNNFLEHHGVKGQKWGVRRYQNPDGTLTERGKKRIQKTYKSVDKMYKSFEKTAKKKESQAREAGKSGKAKMWKYVAEENRKARAERLKNIGNMTYEEFKKSKSRDRFLALYSQRYMDRNASAINMTSKLSRMNERYANFTNLITTAFTFDKVLSYMSAPEAARYINTKRVANQLYNTGYKNGGGNV